MADVTALKDYLKKIQKIISYNADISFGSTRLIKKSKIDDILCCVFASMPDLYKKYLKADYDKRFSSINTFRMLDIELKHKFFLNQNMYSINLNKCNQLINAVFNSIDNDIKKMEEL